MILTSLPYKGKQGEKIIKSLDRTIKSFLNEDTTTRFVYNGHKLSSKFSLKDVNKIEHQHNVIYQLTCPTNDCNATYIGETGRRISERIKEHSGNSGHTSHMSQHSDKYKHQPVSMNDCTILTKINSGSIKFRKITEALMIKKFKPNINKQEASILLKLF